MTDQPDPDGPLDPIEPTDIEEPTERPSAPVTPAVTGPVIARAGTYYRNMRYLMVVLMLGAAAWFGYDGLVSYPEHNRVYDELAAEQQAAARSGDELKQAQLADAIKKLGPKHNDTDIRLQIYLLIGLPIVAVAYTVFFLHRSRGEFRYENGTLHAPGHPPLPVTAFTEIDDDLWKRKGISKLSYQHAGESGTITLDDFIYDADPVRKIHDAVAAAKKLFQNRLA